MGVVIDSNLNFQAHYNSIIGKANRVAGVLRRNFTFGNDKTLCLLYKALVRPILEYSYCTTRPFYNKDIEALEKVQRRITKFCPTLRNLSYEDRLRKLKLPSLAYRLH